MKVTVIGAGLAGSECADRKSVRAQNNERQNTACQHNKESRGPHDSQSTNQTFAVVADIKQPRSKYALTDGNQNTNHGQRYVKLIQRSHLVNGPVKQGDARRLVVCTDKAQPQRREDIADQANRKQRQSDKQDDNTKRQSPSRDALPFGFDNIRGKPDTETQRKQKSKPVLKYSAFFHPILLSFSY